MQPTLSLLMAQFNPTVGEIEKNTQKIIELIKTHQPTHELIIFPELAITGYPPEDLLLRPEFFDQVQKALLTIQRHTSTCHVIVGHPWVEDGDCYNAASVLHQNKVLTRYFKQHLPNEGVFDEKRYFKPGPNTPSIITINTFNIGICICEDIWHPGPVEQVIDAKAQILVCLNASPFEVNKEFAREALIHRYAKQGLWVAYVNLVGGQDELVFDGQSLVMDSQGHLLVRAPAFKEHIQTVIYPSNPLSTSITPRLNAEALIYEALCCGLRDYVYKNGFSGILLGLSGGIDSALTLAIAVDALGASNVCAVMMPSRYTASISNEDALLQLKYLNVTQHHTLPIEPTFETLLATLEPEFKGTTPDITEENMQARIRGILLMALSNKTGKLVLSTSNKSEVAVGYSTLYGDMCGGFCVLKDVLKTSVYRLARYRNTISLVIPARVIDRAPSAELAENQTDQDNLPDYATLDGIIIAYVERKLSATEIIAEGYDPMTVDRVLKLISRNEYKRRQSAPGVKISSCAFGKDWRYPLTSAFKSLAE
jgi:NAD+ synthase (glutamine-hydrolysing)